MVIDLGSKAIMVAETESKKIQYYHLDELEDCHGYNVCYTPFWLDENYFNFSKTLLDSDR